jgi:hypothetical protein
MKNPAFYENAGFNSVQGIKKGSDSFSSGLFPGWK